MQVLSVLRTPSGVNGATSLVAQKAAPGLRASTPRLSNLDCHDRLVKRGLKVSYQGVRGFVVCVRRGRCYVDYIDYLGRKTGSGEWLKCESLQVVA